MGVREVKEDLIIDSDYDALRDAYLRGEWGNIGDIVEANGFSGEVVRRGDQFFFNERVSIMEAIASAGDITPYGRRNKVEVIRQNINGSFHKEVLDLMDANVVFSPYFYLQPNDIVNVPASRTFVTKFNVQNLALIFASITTLILVLNYVQK